MPRERHAEATRGLIVSLSADFTMQLNDSSRSLFTEEQIASPGMGVTRVFRRCRNELGRWDHNRYNNVRSAIFISIVKLAPGSHDRSDPQAPCPQRPTDRLSAPERHRKRYCSSIVEAHALLGWVFVRNELRTSTLNSWISPDA